MPSLRVDRIHISHVAVGMVAAGLAWELVTLVRSLRTARVALAASAAPPEREAVGAAPTLHVLVPGLREQPYVQRTVDAFRALCDGCPNVYVWFITTAREQASDSPRETTRQALARVLARASSDRMAVLHDPSPAGNKASQLNWAVGQLDRRSDPESATWIGVFDFDSQPHSDTARWVTERGRAHNVDVIQVVPIATTTLAGPPAGMWSRGFVLAEALHHATRSLGIERWKLDQAERGRRMPQYVVGAGLFARRDALSAAGGFPFIDDVPLGYRLFLDGARFATVPVLNRVDLPDTPTAHIASLKFIARGVVSWPSVLAATRRTRQARWDRLRLALLGAADSAEMTVYPWLALAATPSLLRGGWRGRVLAMAWWAFPIGQTIVMRRVLATELEPEAWRVPRSVLLGMSVGRRFWRTFGAWRLGADTLRAWTKGTDVTFPKVDRARAATAADRARR